MQTLTDYKDGGITGQGPSKNTWNHDVVCGAIVFHIERTQRVSSGDQESFPGQFVHLG